MDRMLITAENSEYGDILPAYRDLYESLKDYTLVNSFTNEVFNGVEALCLQENKGTGMPFK